MDFYLKVFFCYGSAVVMARSLNHTLDTQSIECVLCVCVWMHGFVLVCDCMCASLCFFLKRYVGVFEAHGSSCCALSCFPASVSTWPCAGCSPETPPRPESWPGCPVPSGCFASSDCS